MPELSGLNVDYASLSIEMQEKMAKESDLLSVGFPDQTIVLLANTLSGVAAMLNYSQLTANLNNFLPFAFLKTAGYAIAATLGVPPRRKSGAEMWIRMRPPGNATNFAGQMDADITIPAYTRFRCRNKIWHTREPYILDNQAPYLDILVHEGTVLVEEFTGLGEKYQRWQIGEKFNVDNNSLRVMVDNQFWEEGEEGAFVYYGPASSVYLQQTSPDGKVLVFFGNGIYGRVPTRGSKVKIYYTATVGFQGNSASVGDRVDLIDPVTIGPAQMLLIDGISTSPASGGEDEHTLDDIKYVIPRLYAANHRAVRRDDYIGHLLGPRCPLVFADARTWGEYEQAYKEGIGKLEMMNRAYWTGMLRTFDAQEEEAVATAAGGGQQLFSFSLDTTTIIPGSLQVTNTDYEAVFEDSQGHGVLVSPDVAFNALTGGTVTAQNTAGGSNVTRLLDANIETYWQSLTNPTLADPIRIIYDLGLGHTITPKSYRLRSSNDHAREQRAFPKIVSLWGSDVSPPLITSDLDWQPIRGRVELNDPGIASWCPWITLDNNTPYRYIMLKLEDRFGSSGFTKICEWQVQDTLNSSTIDYATNQVFIKMPFTLIGGTTLDVSYYGPDLSENQIMEVDIFLKKYNHYTTLLTYKPPIMKRVELELEVYYFSEYNENEVQTKLEAKLTDLFALRKGSIGRKISHSDLMRRVLEVPGIDYVNFVTPELGGDLNVGLGEFLFLVNNRINMYVTDRSEPLNRFGVDYSNG